MKKRINYYIRIVISLIILVSIVFIFNLPKINSFIIIGVITLFTIFIDLVFGEEKGDKKEL